MWPSAAASVAQWKSESLLSLWGTSSKSRTPDPGRLAESPRLPAAMQLKLRGQPLAAGPGEWRRFASESKITLALESTSDSSGQVPVHVARHFGAMLLKGNRGSRSGG